MRGRTAEKPRLRVRPYFVYGLPLANVGGEICECCGRSAAVSRSISMLAVCQGCAAKCDGEAAEIAAEAGS